MTRRAIVTGMGAITPSGMTVDDLFDAAISQRSAIRMLQGDQFADLPIRIGAQITDFDPTTVLSKAEARRLSPVQHWAIAAADQAMEQAGLWDGQALSPAADPARIAIIAATGSGPIDAMQAATRAWDAGGARAVPLSLAVYGSPDSAAAVLTQRYGVMGPAQGLSATCASSAIALGEGLRRIRHGYSDTVLVVGMEDCLGPVNLASNANMRALAGGDGGDPAAACRPFDRDRSGFVMGHGAAAIVLTAAAPATAEGTAAEAAAGSGSLGHVINSAEPLVELAGFGAASDAHHPTAPHPAGRGAAAAIRQCLADAGVRPEEVDTVNAHATGTPTGDAAEIAALASVFGERGAESAMSPAITATKPVTGHLIGASGMVEAIIAAKSLETGLLPPIMNLEHTDFPGWDFVTGEARHTDIGTILANSFGFGGHNGALLFRRQSPHLER